MRVLQAITCATLALALSACCGGTKGDSAKPTTDSKTTGSPSPAKDVPKGVIAAPNEPSGAPRRGIVRSSPDFKAAEVTRLNNGTEIAIDEEQHGGWLKIHWPYPDGTSTGFIHHDVVKR
jgi:hypothetical protein